MGSACLGLVPRDFSVEKYFRLLAAKSGSYEPCGFCAHRAERFWHGIYGFSWGWKLTSSPLQQNQDSAQGDRPVIFCVGANHRTATISDRELFFLTEEQLVTALPVVRDRFGLRELAAISTCNRFELMGVAYGHAVGHDALVNIWADLHREANPQVPLDVAVIKQSAYVMIGLDAVRHIFAVAASLDSLVPGETQITGQFKDALAVAQAAATMGPTLARIGQEALTTAKKIRTQTDIGRRTVSISHAAITLAKRMFRDLSKCRFLIVGAGEMGRMAAEHAKSYEPRQLTIVSRTRMRACELQQHLGIGEAHGLDNLAHLIAHADVVISATSAPGYVIDAEVLKRVMRERRRGGPLFLIDIALPRDIDPKCADFEEVYLFDIDDLKQVVDQHLSERKAAADQAMVMVDASVDQFDGWLASQAIAPTLAAWRQYVAATLQREATKTLSRDIFAGLDERQREALQAMIDAQGNRLAADVATKLRGADGVVAREWASALEDIFPLQGSANRRNE